MVKRGWYKLKSEIYQVKKLHLFQPTWKWFQLIGLIALSCHLTACGFSLQTQSLIPTELNSLYLKTEDPYGEFTLLLKKHFQSQGVRWEASPKNAQYILKIENLHIQQNLLSISENTLIRTYLVSANLEYQLENSKGKVILAPSRLISSITFITNDNQLSSDSQELEDKKEQLYQDLIFKLIARLHSRQVQLAIHEN